MAAPGLVEHLVIELARVVWAQQPPRLALTERDVEQRLVPLALDQLIARAPIPDRLADSAQPFAAGAMLIHEVAPRRDDARWVRSDLGHVCEQHLVRVLVQR